MAVAVAAGVLEGAVGDRLLVVELVMCQSALGAATLRLPMMPFRSRMLVQRSSIYPMSASLLARPLQMYLTEAFGIYWVVALIEERLTPVPPTSKTWMGGKSGRGDGGRDKTLCEA